MTPTPTDPWPDFFEIALAPRAYGALLYQIAGLPLGIAAFTWVVTGLSLSLGLVVIGIGLVLGLAYLVSCRGLAVALGRLAAAIAGMPAPEALAMPEGPGFWSRLGALLSNPASWGAQASLLLRMPWGIAAFTLLVTLLSLSLAAVLAAILPWQQIQLGPDGLLHLSGHSWNLQGDLLFPPILEGLRNHPASTRLLSAAAGLFGFLATLHGALALTRAEAWLAWTLLRRRAVR